MTFRPGDHLVICDMSGQQCYRSECVKQWDGAIVKREYARARHPLDLQRPLRTERALRETRPVNDVFIEYGSPAPESFTPGYLLGDSELYILGDDEFIHSPPSGV